MKKLSKSALAMLLTLTLVTNTVNVYGMESEAVLDEDHDHILIRT